MTYPLPLRIGRARAAWWGFLAVLGIALALFVSAFVGTFLLGLFLYYGVRPLHRRLRTRIDSRGVSASLTLLLVVLPVLVLLGYAGLVALREFAAVAGPGLTGIVLERLPGDPRSPGVAVGSLTDSLTSVEDISRLRDILFAGLGSVAAVANGLLHLTLALALTFFFLRDGPRLEGWFHDDIAAEGGVADAYLTAVDADLGAVYFGNVLTVLGVGAAALAVYNGFNLLAPAALRVPFPTLLALLTGLATFVPLVVGKIVYLPTAGYLAWRAAGADAATGLFPWVVAFLVVAFLVLDLVPQTFVRPYVAGRSLHTGLVLFAYVLGAALFGWYGLFLGPLLAVLVVQAANVVLPELLHGERLTPETYTAIGSEPWGRRPPEAGPDPVGGGHGDDTDATGDAPAGGTNGDDDGSGGADPGSADGDRA